jgi:hypothetical protein|tara:strand:+ start:9647 stop:10570 length:924 start_codon:yes stop_codon:yes gene_type:complete
MVLKKKQSLVGLPKSVRDQINETPNYYEKNNGLYNTHVVEVNPNYNNTDAEVVKKGLHNSFIIMGRDRPRGIDSGYGGIGATQCGTIDIVAGLGGALAKEVDEDDKMVFTDKSPELDSARIYLSQRTDVDDNFNLPKGSVGQAKAKSAVAVKADAVRIIARDGIKLVTGTDVYDGQGVRIDIQEGIDLIAGNNDEDLQPLVKGDNLKEALREIIDLIADLNGVTASFAKMYFQLITALTLHTHISTVPGSPVTPSPDFAVTAVSQYIGLTQMIFNLILHQKNVVSTKVDYTYETGEGYINSIFNNTN